MARADLLRAIHSWATRRGLMPVLSGIDLNPRSAIEAVAATPTGTVIGRPAMCSTKRRSPSLTSSSARNLPTT